MKGIFTVIWLLYFCYLIKVYFEKKYADQIYNETPKVKLDVTRPQGVVKLSMPKFWPTNLKDQEYWTSQVRDNCKDDSSAAVIDCARLIMIALDEGKDFQFAKQPMYQMQLSAFQAGAVAVIVSRSHQRGEEFSKDWNRFWGVEQTGPVNPAVFQASEKNIPQ